MINVVLIIGGIILIGLVELLTLYSWWLLRKKEAKKIMNSVLYAIHLVAFILCVIVTVFYPAVRGILELFSEPFVLLAGTTLGIFYAMPMIILTTWSSKYDEKK